MEVLFDALPKNSMDRLDNATASFALHRYFLHRHGWYLNALDARGYGQADTSPAEILADCPQVDGARSVFHRLDDIGFSHMDLSYLGAIAETMVQSELAELLKTVFDAEGYSLEGTLSVPAVTNIIEVYMILFLIRGSFRSAHMNLTPGVVKKLKASFNVFYPNWNNLKIYLGVSIEAKLGPRTSSNPTRPVFREILELIEDIADKMSMWQDKEECNQLKLDLVHVEDRGTGRVPILAFYKSALGGKINFKEDIKYLRDLGTLDETIPGNPRVIIPNYVTSLSNCFAGSRYYSLCCLNECEPLFLEIEKVIGQPDALPEKIIEIVSRLPSQTTPAPREIPSKIVDRLYSIAQKHSGMVPIHGRLFQQWMHHVYPRECPYPHINGTIKPMKATVWSATTGEKSTVTDSQLEDLVTQFGAFVPDTNRTDTGEVAAWCEHEELFVRREYTLLNLKYGMSLLKLTLISFACYFTLTKLASITNVASRLSVHSKVHCV